MKFIDKIKELNKLYPDTIVRGDAVPPISKLPTGVFVFDMLTGGGLPMGKIIEFHGDKSTGKSTMALKSIGNYLRLYPDMLAIYVDFENTYNVEWAGHFIDDLDRLYSFTPDIGEAGVDLIIKSMDSEDVGLIVIDSLAMMVASPELSNDTFQNFVGLQARLINKLLRKVNATAIGAFNSSNRLVTVILLNQIRYKVDGARSFQPMICKPGGKMQDAAVSLDVRFYTKDYIKENDIPVKVVHNFIVEKNKVGTPKCTGEYRMHLINNGIYKIGDIDDLETVVKYAKKCGILVREGTKWHLGTNKTFSVLADVVAYLTEDTSANQKVKSAVIDKYISNPASFLKDE